MIHIFHSWEYEDKYLPLYRKCKKCGKEQKRYDNSTSIYGWWLDGITDWRDIISEKEI